VNRATRLFLAALVCAAAMLGAGRSIRPGIDSAGVLQRVMWPLTVAVATLAGSALAFAFS
jgi:hypothetical protein